MNSTIVFYMLVSIHNYMEHEVWLLAE